MVSRQVVPGVIGVKTTIVYSSHLVCCKSKGLPLLGEWSLASLSSV
jgi:hypothetical protein